MTLVGFIASLPAIEARHGAQWAIHEIETWQEFDRREKVERAPEEVAALAREKIRLLQKVTRR